MAIFFVRFTGRYGPSPAETIEIFRPYCRGRNVVGIQLEFSWPDQQKHTKTHKNADTKMKTIKPRRMRPDAPDMETPTTDFLAPFRLTKANHPAAAIALVSSSAPGRKHANKKNREEEEEEEEEEEAGGIFCSFFFSGDPTSS